MHRSHDRPRLEPPRLRELKSPPAAVDGKPRGGSVRPWRSSNRSLLAAVTKAAAREGAPAAEAREIAREVLSVYRAAKIELGSSGPSATAHLIAFALGTVVHQRLTIAAVDARLASDRGIVLLERAAKTQARAERAWTAAVAACGLLGRQPGDAPRTPRPPAAVEAELARMRADAAYDCDDDLEADA
jgi:hypothetical protein